MEIDSNFSCFTYENILTNDDPWGDIGIVWVMGKCFHLPEERTRLLECIHSCIWFTYRKGFEPIAGTGPTGDSGWGCMLRCGQMMLAQALVKRKLDPKWKWRPNEMQNDNYYKILKCFADRKTSCFSIHQIAQMGVQEGKNIGEWFGPNTVAQVLKKLTAFDNSTDVVIHVAMDSTVCRNDIINLCRQNASNSDAKNSILKSSEDEWKPLVLIVPLRLGLNSINPTYFNSLKSCFTWEQSVGVIGGKPNHAYYFIGYTDSDSLVFLDPHTTQQNAIWCEEKLDIPHDHSYHCDSPSKMPISQLDPSLAVGFFCADHHSFENLCEKVGNQAHTKEESALFTVVNSFPSFDVFESRAISVARHNKKVLSGGQEDETACLTLDSDEDLNDIDEEFEILDVC